MHVLDYAWSFVFTPLGRLALGVPMEKMERWNRTNR